MARAIDKQTMLDPIVEAKRTDPETGSFAEWLAEYLAEHLPAFTLPNEPLTLEQLREMDAPVWCSCKPIEGGDGYWCLCRYGHITTPGRTFFEVGEIPHWVFYRRPPEGEANE